MSSNLWGAKAVARGCNLQRVGASGAEVGGLASRRLVVEIVVGWEPRSCLQVGIVGIAVLQAEIAWAAVRAAGMMALAVDKPADTALGTDFEGSVGSAAAASSDSWLQCGLADCSNNRRDCLLLLPSTRVQPPALCLPRLRG